MMWLDEQIVILIDKFIEVENIWRNGKTDKNTSYGTTKVTS